MLRFALPSKGSGYESALALLDSCGLRVVRANPRQYTAVLRGLPNTEVLLHRPADIVEKVAEGSIDIGITGYDLVVEQRGDDEDLLVLFDDLGFWRVELVFAVPQGWVDVHTWRIWPTWRRNCAPRAAGCASRPSTPQLCAASAPVRGSPPLRSSSLKAPQKPPRAWAMLI